MSYNIKLSLTALKIKHSVAEVWYCGLVNSTMIGLTCFCQGRLFGPLLSKRPVVVSVLPQQQQVQELQVRCEGLGRNVSSPFGFTLGGPKFVIPQKFSNSFEETFCAQKLN